MTARSNEAWLHDLNAEGEQREAALTDLHTHILQAMPYALSRYLSPKDAQFNALAEDVAQETLVRVLEKLDTFQGRSQFTTWVYKIAIHIALSELRRKRWKDVSLDELLSPKDSRPEEPIWLSDPGSSPETAAEKNDALARVRRLIIEELTDKQREAMVAIVLKGMPMSVVAEKMGSNANALYKLMHDARLRLRKKLEEEGFSLESLLTLFD